jgi:hypothetical protein
MGLSGEFQDPGVLPPRKDPAAPIEFGGSRVGKEAADREKSHASAAYRETTPCCSAVGW